MAAAAGGASAYPKSDSTHSGLVGNIQGQDVEASKGVVYWSRLTQHVHRHHDINV